MQKLFKPTSKVLVLAAGLILITVFLPHYTLISPHDPPGTPSYYDRVDGIGYPSFYGTVYQADAGYKHFNVEFFILNLLWAYILSCLIIGGIRKLFQMRQNSKPL